MYCPNCGIDEKQPNQFCRACGTNLLPVRDVVERPDGVTASAINAREEIGRAVAARIRETQDVYELKKVAEDVLPEIEKFLESPEEKRVRRIRTGTLVSFIGVGAIIGAFLAGALADEELFILLAPATATFFVGFAFMFNGLFFTVPKKSLANKTENATSQRELDAGTSDFNISGPEQQFTSVTESTTRHLKHRILP